MDRDSLRFACFLDFDGVLHPKCANPEDYFCFLNEFEKLLRNYPSMQVVVSSNWRYTESICELRSHFSFDVQYQIIATTGLNSNLKKKSRYEEICEFLLERDALNHPWFALDDSKDEFPLGITNLILCNPGKGYNHETRLLIENWIENYGNNNS